MPPKRPPIVPFLGLLLLIVVPVLAAAQQDPEVASRLRTGLLSLNPEETLSVVVADVADVSPGSAFTIRFIDSMDEELARTEAYLSPGQPVTAELVRDQYPTAEDRLLVRLEIVMTAEQAGAEPIINVSRGFGDILQDGWSCAGMPADREGPDTLASCPGARVDDLLAE